MQGGSISFYFFIKGKNTRKPLFQIDRMAWNRQRTQGTGLVSCCKSLHRKFTANNAGDPAKEADLGDVTAKPGLGGGGLVRSESVCVCVCVV